MNDLALKMLLGDRAKYIMLISGLTFATLLMTEQAAIFCGLMHSNNFRTMKKQKGKTKL